MNRNEIKKKIEDLQYEASMMKNKEQAVKLMLNSIYGAFGNEYFYFYNVNMAESITGQGKDAILHTEKILNSYFKRAWHLDKDIHKELNITVTDKIENPATIYIDTDSCYISFSEVLSKVKGWSGNIKDFILKIYELRLKGFLEIKMQKYADDHNAENFLSFELETIADNGIWLAKKSYIQNITWKDGKNFDPLDKIKITGFAAIQSSTPSFCRSRLKDLIVMILSGDDLNISKLVKKLKEIKKEFMLADIEDISINKRANKIGKYIIQDEDKFEYTSGAQAHVKGVGLYNFLIVQHKLKNKYSPIKDAEKVRFYYTKNKTDGFEAFSYKAGEYPHEIAPPIDRELQYEKTIIDHINRIIKASGRKGLTRELIYTKSLF